MGSASRAIPRTGQRSLVIVFGERDLHCRLDSVREASTAVTVTNLEAGSSL